MHRPNFRQQSPGVASRPGGFRSPPTTGGHGAGEVFQPQPWAIRGGPPSAFGSPRYGQFIDSPNASRRDVGGNGNWGCLGRNDGQVGFYNCSSPAQTPHRRNSNPRGGPPYRNSSPRQFMENQYSPRTSFGSSHGRDRGADGVEKYYSPAMLQDPWAILQPVAVTSSNFSYQQSSNTGRPGRYY